MQERSEEQLVDRLFELESQDQAERRAELTDERFLSLIEDPDTGRGYVFRHGANALTYGLDDTEPGDVPQGTEFWEYANLEEAGRAFESVLNEARDAGELVEEDSNEEIGDVEADGAELNDLYSASDEDALVNPDEDSEQR
jgi:hypothetical protein